MMASYNLTTHQSEEGTFRVSRYFHSPSNKGLFGLTGSGMERALIRNLVVDTL